MTERAARICAFLHPILFAAFPLLSLFQQNESEVELSVLWTPLALSVAAAVGLFTVFLLITKRAATAGALASLVVVAFFYFGIFFEALSGLGLSEGWFFVAWVALFAGGVFAVVRARRSLVSLTVIAGVAAGALALPAAAKIAAYQSDHPGMAISDPRLWPAALPNPPAGARARPDIYVVIPDDYARPDVLRQYFHYQDADFLRRPKARGFVFSGQARAPYSDSESNIAAALNMGYLDGLRKVLGATSQDVRPVKRLIEDNRAARLLKTLGYEYIHLDTDEVTFAGGNPRISSLAPPDSFANLWLHKSALRLLGGPIGSNESAMNQRFRDSVQSQFSALAATPRKAGPKFVLFHTLLPHDPYVFAARGEPVTFPGRSDEDLGSRLGMRYYLRQLQFLNRKLLATVDAILAESRTPPIVVIQSDEGFQADSATFGEAAMRDIRVKGLIDLYLPGLRGVSAPHPPNTVNTLRFVFNHYFGTHITPCCVARAIPKAICRTNSRRCASNDRLEAPRLRRPRALGSYVGPGPRQLLLADEAGRVQRLVSVGEILDPSHSASLDGKDVVDPVRFANSSEDASGRRSPARRRRLARRLGRGSRGPARSRWPAPPRSPM